MSGIVALVQLDNAPVDQTLLAALTDHLAFRGPDALSVQVCGSIGLGHTLFATTQTAHSETQPCSLDGRVWITADARIDGQSELRRSLIAYGRDLLPTTTDPELILQAYHVWGDTFLDHLIGDFAFVLWDQTQQKLLCARDHFGVKPLYHARFGDSLLISNTLTCIQQHPAFTAELNELAIADFLLFGYKQDPHHTSFAAIKRIPPAHVLTCQFGTMTTRRYWSMTVVDQPLHFEHPTDYIEAYREVLDSAVVDRLRVPQAALFMSGGLDSSSVAASAVKTSTQLKAFTVVYDKLIPDTERYWTTQVAQFLGIEVDFLTADDYQLFAPKRPLPEPTLSPLTLPADQFRRTAAYSRVVLGGDGGDSALYPSKTYFDYLFRQRQFGALAGTIGSYSVSNRKLPPFYVRSRLKRRAGLIPIPLMPNWLNPALAKRLDLQTRWQTHYALPKSPHPFRSEAYNHFGSAMWQNLFELSDAGFTGFPLELRHPFFDVRLVTYVLSLPPVPWCINKMLAREAMQGQLPDLVRMRPKTPLAGSPVHPISNQCDWQWATNKLKNIQIAPYVNEVVVDEWLQFIEQPNRFFQFASPLSLASWFIPDFTDRKKGKTSCRKTTRQMIS